MKTGRKLDAAVAEKVMGYVWCRDTSNGRSDIQRESMFKKGTRALRREIWKDQGWEKATMREKRAPRWDYDVPYFSKHIEHAWLVYEKMAGLGEVAFRKFLAALCQVSAKRAGFKQPVYLIRALRHMDPEAICLAALKCYS